MPDRRKKNAPGPPHGKPAPRCPGRGGLLRRRRVTPDSARSARQLAQPLAARDTNDPKSRLAIPFSATFRKFSNRRHKRHSSSSPIGQRISTITTISVWFSASPQAAPETLSALKGSRRSQSFELRTDAPQRIWPGFQQAVRLGGEGDILRWFW